ncbi:hypothetical protein [Moraxella bovis]|uniref:hypothetical protein n=1 Tax=Moraxella bovis TaxID=476 RepID=UPI00099255A1|nr:hypothetical protein [Moraxella bovis]OOR90728.1 hypothetical protein B0182_04675 [Moraxella bovis]UZA06751.1 hypothetical protein LP099_02740 [Moraxella bovis]UZA11021.1 hypothetical protein LP123_11555 [Moraxella bovis]UZA16194.1 hypothetical protein LP109_11210 [Moraxella bovis]
MSKNEFSLTGKGGNKRIYNIGIGGGALLGGMVIAHQALGLTMIGYVGAGVMLLAVLVHGMSVKMTRHA